MNEALLLLAATESPGGGWGWMAGVQSPGLTHFRDWVNEPGALDALNAALYRLVQIKIRKYVKNTEL